MVPARSTAERGPAELLLGDLLAERALDHRRTGREHLAGAVDHHRPVRKNRAPGRTAGGGAEHGAHHRHLAQQLDRALEAVHAGKHGMAAPVDRRHAAARAVDQVDQRNAVAGRQILDEAALAALLAIARPARAAADGEVLAADRDRPAVDAGEAHHVGRRRDARQASLRHTCPGP